MKKSEKTGKNESSFAVELFYWAQALAVCLVVLVLINTFFFRMSGVVGSSMVPTLHQSERVILRVIGYNEPKRGDIVVVSAPNYDDDPLVKRIIAVGGDEISIDSATGQVSINGVVQYEPYIKEMIRDNGDWDYPITVPEGYVFFMGDNRNGSSDSRDSVIGMQPVSNVIGKVVYRIWPIKSIGAVK